MKRLEIGTFINCEDSYDIMSFVHENNLNPHEFNVYLNILKAYGFDLITNKFDSENFIFDDYENNPYMLYDIIEVWFDNEGTAIVKDNSSLKDSMERLKKKLLK